MLFDFCLPSIPVIYEGFSKKDSDYCSENAVGSPQSAVCSSRVLNFHASVSAPKPVKAKAHEGLCFFKWEFCKHLAPNLILYNFGSSE
jgi:hypothetical protein